MKADANPTLRVIEQLAELGVSSEGIPGQPKPEREDPREGEL